MPHTATLNASPPAPAPAADAAATAPLFAMLSHAGRVRHNNQDACGALPERSAFVVCDGVGGSAGGEIASQLAVESFLQSLARSAGPSSELSPHLTSNGSQPAPSTSSAQPGHSDARLREAIRTANHDVFQRAQRSASLRGMATTLVAALLDPTAAPLDPAAVSEHSDTTAQNGAYHHTSPSGSDPSAAPRPTLWLAHVGDSRAYLFRDNTLTLLTRDHSLVEEQIEAGLLSRADAARSPIRNVITRAIGAQPVAEPDLAAHSMEPGDLVLLASDGLTRELEDAAIARILIDSLAPSASHATLGSAARTLGPAARIPGSSPQISSATLDAAVCALVAAANAHGGRDNITVLLLASP